MEHAEKIAQVRQLVTERLRQSRIEPGGTPVSSILMQDGFYWGHRFRFDGGWATWSIDDDRVEFFGRASHLPTFIRTDEEPSQLPKAA